MHRKITSFYLTVFIVLSLSLLTGALVMAHDTDQPGTLAAQDGPAADGQALLDYIVNQNPYTEWGTFPADRWSDFGGPLMSGAPHGNTVVIYVNDVALDSIAADDFDGLLPYGSIVVKENWMGTVEEPGELAALTVMYKVEGFNPEGGDWFWLKAAGDGSAIDAEGAVEGCIGCHSQEGNADYLTRYAFGEEPAAVYNDPLPEAAGQAVIDYVLETSPYTEWGSWPATETDDFPGPLASGEPHGSAVRIFVNDRGLASLHRDGALPYGTIVVKENWMGTVEEPGELAALTIMYKVQGFNPEAGDWFWIKAAGDGSAIDAEGAVEGCIGCHGQDGNADYMLRFDPVAYAEAHSMMGDEMGDTSMSIDANAVIDRSCTTCHTRERIDNAKGAKDAAGWAATIDRMIGYGANVSAEERQAMIDYLSQ